MVGRGLDLGEKGMAFWVHLFPQKLRFNLRVRHLTDPNLASEKLIRLVEINELVHPVHEEGLPARGLNRCLQCLPGPHSLQVAHDTEEAKAELGKKLLQRPPESLNGKIGRRGHNGEPVHRQECFIDRI